MPIDIVRFEEEKKSILGSEIVPDPILELAETSGVRDLAPLIPNYYTKCLSAAKNKGLWMEFGVYNGRTINFIASKTPNTVYGFDSFKGLPSGSPPWRPRTYSMLGRLPKVAPNVELVVGLYRDTLNKFLEGHPENVAYMHIDCDIYFSTKDVFDILWPRIVPGTVISFDEICCYKWENDGELKAWLELIEHTGLKYKWLYRYGSDRYEKATCIIL